MIYKKRLVIVNDDDLSTDIENADVHKYITDIGSDHGITIKPYISESGIPNNNYLQINSDSIDFFRGAGTNGAAVSVMSLSNSSFRMGLENGSHVSIKSGGITIWGGSEADDNNNYGFFGNYVRIGALNQNYTKIDNEGFKIYNKGINLIFSLGNKTYSFDDTYEDTNAYYQVDETHIPEEIYLQGQCINPAATGYFLVYLNGDLVTPRPEQAYPLNWTYNPYCYTMDDRGNFDIVFNGRNSNYPLSDGDELLVKAQISGDLETTSLTFGTQPVHSSNSSPGFLSTNFGELNYTLGKDSLSVGYGNLTLGNAAASIGYGLTTTSNFGLTIGRNNAISNLAFTRTSDRTVSTGKQYFKIDGAMHWALIPEPSGDPYALGWYELYGSHRNDYAFIIGNGSMGTTNYSNALTVDWDGNLWTAGNIRATTESTTITIPTANNFTVYTGSPYTTNTDIKLRRFGNVVTITGMVRPTTTITINDETEYTICSIPTEYSSWCPPQVIVQIMQGSTQYKWCLKINTNGTVTFSRYSGTTSYAQVTTSTWLPFHATWIVDS